MQTRAGFAPNFCVEFYAEFDEISRDELVAPKSDQSDQSKLNWLKPGAIKLKRSKTMTR